MRENKLTEQKIYNLNEGAAWIKIGDFEYGKTENIEVKIGKKFYILDIDKDHLSSHLEFYKKLGKDRSKYSKYDKDAGRISVEVKNDAYLSRTFFEDIKKISEAQDIYKKYGSQIIK